MTDANKAPADSYAELLQRYATLKARYPEEFTVSKTELVAWHDQQLKIAETDNAAQSRSFHAERLRCLTDP